MSAATAQAPAATPEGRILPLHEHGACPISGWWSPLAVGLAGGRSSAGCHRVGIKQFLFSWLFAFMFFFTISMGGLFWTMLHYAVDAEWSVVVRRHPGNDCQLLHGHLDRVHSDHDLGAQDLRVDEHPRSARTRRWTTSVRCSTPPPGPYSRSSSSRSSSRRATPCAGSRRGRIPRATRAAPPGRARFPSPRSPCSASC